MTTLIQIILNQNCDSCSETNGALYDFGKDYALPFILAAGAAYMAYLIFVIETKRDKNKEEAKKSEERSDKLFFLSALVESVIETSTQQRANIEEFIQDVDKSDVEFHLMTWVSLNDIRRVVEELNLEDYHLAYVNYYPLQRKESVKEFKSIIAAIDFLSETFKQIPLQLERAQKFDYERKEKIGLLFSEAWKRLADLTIFLQRSHPNEAKILGAIMEKFQVNFTTPSDINFYNEFFFVPINDFCVANINPMEAIWPNVRELASLTLECKQMVMQIKSENQILKDHLVQDSKNIERATLELKGYSKNLLKNFNAK